ncbi:MAG: hypothetical protein QXS51_03585 [Thermoproteota archaeon]
MSTVTTASRVIFSFTYSAPASSFPSGRWLGPVLSVAGAASGTTPSGLIYQSGAALLRDNSVTWAPQAWYGASRVQYKEFPNIGTGNSILFVTRMDIGSGTVLYRLYVYRSWSDYDNDVPVIYQWSHSTNDVAFLVGNRSYGGFNIKHFQFGVESNQPINGIDWLVTNTNMAYYDGSKWRYLPGYATLGNVSHITWIGNYIFGIGGTEYRGVNVGYNSTDTVWWRYTGTTVKEGKLLWSGSGIISSSRTPYL